MSAKRDIGREREKGSGLRDERCPSAPCDPSARAQPAAVSLWLSCLASELEWTGLPAAADEDKGG